MSTVKENSVKNSRQDLNAHTNYIQHASRNNEKIEARFSERERSSFIERCLVKAKNYKSKNGKKSLQYALRQVIVSPSKILTPEQEAKMVDVIKSYRNIPDDIPYLVSVHYKKRENHRAGDDVVPHYHIDFPYVMHDKIIETGDKYLVSHAIARHLEIMFGETYNRSRKCVQVADLMREKGYDDYAKIVDNYLASKPKKYEPRPTRGVLDKVKRLQDEGKIVNNLLDDFRSSIKRGVEIEKEDLQIVIRDALENYGCELKLAETKTGQLTVMLHHYSSATSFGSFRNATGIKTEIIQSEVIPNIDTLNRRLTDSEKPQEQPQGFRPRRRGGQSNTGSVFEG